MNTEHRLETEHIDHLGIGACICHETDLTGAFNQAVGPGLRKKRCGAAVQATDRNTFTPFL